MKFSVLQENFAKGLQIISRATPTKASLPVLSNVLIVAKNGSIGLSATNLETAIITKIGASIDKEGSAAVPAKLIKDFVTNLPPNTIKATLKDHVLHLQSDKTKSRFNGVNPQDFPVLPDRPKKAKYIELSPEDLILVAGTVAFAAGNDVSRPVLTGIYLKYSRGKLIAASTNGFRLSEKKIKVQGNSDSFSTVIPAKTFLEVARIFGNSEEPIKIVVNEDENLTSFFADDTFVTTRMLEGQYPDYNKIIPKDSSISAVFSAEEFLEAVKLTSIFAKESNSTIKLRLDPEGEIKVVSLSGETGEHESTFPAEIDGKLMEIAFNSKYLLDFLSNVKPNQLTLTATGNTSPCVITPDNHRDFLHIVMPVQL